MKRFIILLCMTILFSSPAHARSYTVNTGFTPPVSDIYRLILEDAFARMGEQLDFREVFGEQAIKLVSEGVDDGECCRIWEMDSMYPHLLRIPVPVINVDFVAFVKDVDIQVENWNSLKPFEVGVVNGWKILVQGLQAHPPRKLYILETPDSLFGMLARDRIQVATIDRLVGYQKIRDLGLEGIRVAEPPLVSRPLYFFLHEKNRHLAPKLEKTLRAMEQDGSLQRHYQSIVDQLLDRPDQAP